MTNRRSSMFITSSTSVRPRLQLPALAASMLLLGTFAGACVESQSELEADPIVDESSDEERFILWPNAQNYLIQRIRSGSSVRVCLSGTGVNATSRPGFESTIRSAIVTWVDGVRPTSTTALITGSDVIFSCTSTNVNINWSASSGRAHAGAGFINLFAGDSYAVVLHEFGHVFGLGDTYIEGVWTCTEGQENSVMCGSGGLFSTLQRDDVNAIQETFCMAFPGQCRRRWEANMNWCSHSSGRLLLGDFNGDNRKDMLCHDASTGYKWTSLASTSGTFSGTSWEANMNWCSHSSGRLHIADFNGDNRSDMLCHDVNTGYKWIAYATAGGGFTGTNWEANMNWCSHSSGQLHVGDFNGDARADLLCHDTSTGYKWIAHATSWGTFTTTTWEANLGWCSHAGSQLHLGDFNGDRRSDMLCHDSTGYKWIAYATTGGAFTGTNWEANLGWCSHGSGRLLIGDYNADSRSDLLCHDVSTGQKWIALAQSDATFRGTSRVWSMGWCSHASGQFLTGDFNGNGAADFMCHDRSTGYKWLAYQNP